MSIVNQRGVFHKKLFVSRNGHNKSRCVLKHKFLKKTENYALQITDFYINKTPTIFSDEDEVLFEILQHEGLDGDVGDWLPHFFESNLEFKAQNCYSVPELIRQMTTFLHRFGFLVQSKGYRTTGANLPNFPAELQTLPRAHANFLKQNIQLDVEELPSFVYRDFGYGDFANSASIAKIDITKDNIIRVHYSPEFAANFYIRFSEKMRKRLGFATRSLVSAQKMIWNAENTIAHLDERISIDIVGTLHASSKISVLNSNEEREYIIGRFPLAQADEFKTKSYYSDNETTGVTTISSTYPLGMQNLTRFNPSFESNHLLNGNISEINLELRTRYFEEGKFISYDMESEDAFWSLVMLFSKKV